MNSSDDSLVKEGKILPLMEAFYSIQGEGFYSGKASYFLRIGGCDVGCHWCDVKESWDANLHPLTSVKEIIKLIDENKVNTVVITGGEPLMWNMSFLTNSLKKKGLQVHLETSGSHPLSGKFDWICLSPKKNQKALDEIKGFANELKIIVQNKHDLKWAKEQQKKVSKSCELYLQPEWSKKDEVTPLITDFVMKNTDWQISLQIHKYMNLP